VKKVIYILLLSVLYAPIISAQELPKTAKKLEKLYSKDARKSIEYANKLVSKRKDVDVAYYYLTLSYYKEYKANNKISYVQKSVRYYEKFKKNAQHSIIQPDNEIISEIQTEFGNWITSKFNPEKYKSSIKYCEKYEALFGEKLDVQLQIEAIQFSETAEARAAQDALIAQQRAREEAKKLVQVNEQKLIKDAEALIGTPYLYGGSTRRGLDCSGFVMYVYGLNGVKISHSSKTQSGLGQIVPREECKPGDLVFFGSNKNGRIKIQHAALVYSNINGELKIIHCPNSGVCIEGEGDPGFDMYWEKRFLFVRRLTNQELLIAKNQ